MIDDPVLYSNMVKDGLGHVLDIVLVVLMTMLIMLNRK